MLFYSSYIGSGVVPYTDMGVCAGFPSPAMDYTTESINLNDILVRDKDITNIAFASGNLTFGAKVRDNDILIIDRGLKLHNHDLAVCLLDGEYYLRRIKLADNGVFLCAPHKEEKAVQQEPGGDWSIYGIVTYSIRPHRKDIQRCYDAWEDEATFNLHKELTRESPGAFVTYVKGNSMHQAHVQNKDLLVVDKLLEPRNNDLVIAFIDREFTLKRFRQENGKVWLLPANENFRPIEVTAEQDFEIWGVVTYSIRNHRHYE